MEVSLVLDATGKSGRNKEALADVDGRLTLHLATREKKNYAGRPTPFTKLSTHSLSSCAKTNSNLDQTHARSAFEAIETELAFLSDFLTEFLLPADKSIGS